GTSIGIINILSTGDSEILDINLTGDNANYFKVNIDGSIILEESLDYDNGIKDFNLTAIARNYAGQSNQINVAISVNDVPDINAVLKAFSGNVEENVTSSMNLGQISITQGDSNITSINLTGEGEGNFTVNNSGIIKLSTNANIDYESGYIDFTLKAIAVNSSGNSNSSDVNLTLVNIPDVKPIIGGIYISMDENTSIGTEIGTIDIIEEGDSNITSIIMSGLGEGNFTVDKSGVIKLSSDKDIDYDRGDINIGLKAVAKNLAGNSNIVDINITIIDIPDITPSLGDSNGTIDENASIGTLIGVIDIIDIGDSHILDFNITGDDANHFDINKNGDILLNHLLDYETKPKYTLNVTAQNTAGDSNKVNLLILINDIVDTPATLTAFSGYVQENATSSMDLGQISITQGDSNITSITLTGEGEGNFTVDISGIIRLSTNANIDYESGYIDFILKAFATNSTGNSNSVDVNLTLIDIPDVVPVLGGGISKSIDENASIGTLIGVIDIIDTGDSDISSINFSGEGDDFFIISDDGNITLNNLLDYREKSEYILKAEAINDAGNSNSMDVNITIDKDINSFVTFWDTTISASTNSFQLKIGINPYSKYNYNYSVNWGDGEITYNITEDITHTYANEGQYRVKIAGVFPHLFSGQPYSQENDSDNYDGLKLLRIEQWGTQKWQNMSSTFCDCRNMELNATDIPNLSEVINMNYMFYNARKMNSYIGDWNISNIISISGLFEKAKNFNQPLKYWDVSKVQDMNNTFYGATKFNQSLYNWNVEKVIGMNNTFNGAISFNQRLEAWVIKKVTNMEGMLDDTNLSVYNYNTTLNGWSNKEPMKYVTLGANNLKYDSNGTTGRNTLIDDYNWTINDAGLVE
nr:BspA family leucine-rich repeat surface protein [Sulfurovaceae bacterium]